MVDTVIGSLINNTSPLTTSGPVIAGNISVTANSLPTNGLFSPATNQLGFATNSTQVLTINSLGNVGIGTSTINSGNAVAIYGGNLYVGSTNSGIRFADGSYQSTAFSGTASGALVKISYLTSGTSFTTQSTTTKIFVECVGGGAGGGGVSSSGSAGGGGSGAYCAKTFTVTGSTAYTYAVGSGGSGGGAGGGGSTGGNTTFTVGATTITAAGGNGGGAGSGGSVAGGGSGGSATNGDINAGGGNGGNGIGNGLGGFGAASVFGQGAQGGIGSPGANGGSATPYGSGGGGGCYAATGSQSASGGSGAQGIIRVTEYT